MALTRSEREDILRRILEVDREYKHVADVDDAVAVPGQPASESAISRLVSISRSSLPASYLDLLRLHDGIKAFYWVEDDLLSCEDQAGDPGYADHWQRPQMRFFIMGNDFEGVAFDTTTRRPDGEMEAVEFARNVESVRWPSLDDFLLGYLARLEGWMEKAKADRAQMDDD
jgi:hypothetical protein